VSALIVTTMTGPERDRLATGGPDAGLGALQTERGNLPLELIDVRAELAGLAGAVRLTQGFTNPYDQPLEATYVFPLPDRFAVTGMTMTADDRTVEAVLRERAAARAEYEKAVSEGKRASIAEEERPDVFTMRVGNILPGERVSVHLSLAGPLSYEDGEATFRFPLVVAPRYIPGQPLDGRPVGDGYAPDTDAVPDASRITPPVLLPRFPNPVRLAIQVTVDTAGLPLDRARSSLPTEQGEDGTIRVVPGQRADQDFVLRLQYGEPVHASHGLALSPDTGWDAKAGGGVMDGPEGTFQLTVLPPTGAAVTRPRDLVLVLDRSGSMAGWKMVAARRAAARIVDTLTGADRFTVLTFDSVVERAPDLPPGLVAATDRHRFRAVEHLARAHARGGTEMLKPLREALDLLTSGSAPAGEERDRVLVLVTDGQVGNEDQILRETAAATQQVRVHTVGIDRAVNAGFLGRLAAFGGGRCELVESEDRLDEAMDHIHRRIGAPLVTGLTVDSDGIEVLDGTLSPGRHPDLFPGAPVVFTGRYRGTPAGALTVRGHDRDGAVWQARVEGSTVGRAGCEGGWESDGDAVRATWARAHLRDLEDRYATLEPGPRLTELERRIVETSLRFGVLCRFTAYVAVDSRVVTDGSGPHRVIQPVEPAAGWEMLQAPGIVAPAGAMTMAAMSSPMGTEAAAPKLARGGAMRAVGGFGTARSRMVPQGVMGRAAGRPTMALGEVRELAGLELRRLRTAGEASRYERRQLLDDLATRLAALLGDLTAAGGGDELVEPVRQLVEAIQTGREGLDELWTRALQVLEKLAGPAGTTTDPAGNPSRGPFWKR
jgi:Ca-activated chloride channel family protein